MEGGGYGEGRGLMHGKDGYGLNGYSQEKNSECVVSRLNKDINLV